MGLINSIKGAGIGNAPSCSSTQGQGREEGGTEGWKERTGWHPEDMGVVREESTNSDSGGAIFRIGRCSWPARQLSKSEKQCPCCWPGARCFLGHFLWGSDSSSRLAPLLSSGLTAHCTHPTSQISFWKSLLINLLAAWILPTMRAFFEVSCFI